MNETRESPYTPAKDWQVLHRAPDELLFSDARCP